MNAPAPQPPTPTDRAEADAPAQHDTTTEMTTMETRETTTCGISGCTNAPGVTRANSDPTTDDLCLPHRSAVRQSTHALGGDVALARRRIAALDAAPDVDRRNGRAVRALYARLGLTAAARTQKAPRRHSPAAATALRALAVVRRLGGIEAAEALCAAIEGAA